MCVCDQRSFGIAHLGVKSSYFCKYGAESQEEQLCLWLTKLQLCSRALGVCPCSWFVKRQTGADCHNRETSFSSCSYGESSPLVEKKKEIVSLGL